MSKYAHITDGVAVQVIETDPATSFHPEIASLFIPCPDEVTVGSTVDDKGNWTIAIEQVPAPESGSVAVAPKVSPVQFKLLFTPQERVAMKILRATDLVLDDFFDIVDDPRLTEVDMGLQSTKDTIAYLTTVPLDKPILTSSRAVEIVAGTLK